VRNLRSFGVNIERSQIPEKPLSRPPPSTNKAATRIDEPADSEDGVEWQVVPNYQDAEEGDAEWIFKGRDDESLERALGQLAEAIDHAKAASHVGYLTLTQRSAFPKIVGTKGATVARLRAETGTDITVGREDNTIIIIGVCFAVIIW
jgi:KH domain